MTSTLYTLTVWATISNDEDGIPMISKKDAERQILDLLQRSEMDCDVELVDTEVVDE